MEKSICFALLFLLPAILFAQEPEIGRLIDCPTAAVVKHGELVARVQLFTGGGLCVGGETGVLPNLAIGLYYGANNLIGNSEIRWFKYPGISLSYRFSEADGWYPAASVGLTTQGVGPYFDPGPCKDERFVTKAKGFWVAGSNLFDVDYIGIVGAHIGVNLNPFENSDDRDFSFYLGLNKSLGAGFEAVTEYDIATNDDSRRALGRGRGYWNIGLQWEPFERFTAEIIMRDLLTNNKLNSTPSREMRFSYRIPLWNPRHSYLRDILTPLRVWRPTTAN
jgi:hypothetical protein